MTKIEKPRRTRVLFAALLAGTALAGGVALWSYEGTARAAVSTEAGITVAAVQPGFADLAEQVKPAVVNIQTARSGNMKEGAGQGHAIPPGSPFSDMFRHFFQQGPDMPMRAQGSGFIIDAAGYVVTNNHVIAGADKITVTLDDGRDFQAKVVGQDDKTDLAVLKIEAGKPLPQLAFGDSDKVRTGDWVVAVGNPFGLGGSVTAGIVSAHGRDINAGPYDDFLQIDAPINPGNSGGPLFDQAGKVIGVSTAIVSPNGGNVGIGFAIPSKEAAKVVAELREHGSVERGWLGVQMQPITEPLAAAIGRADEKGVLVSDVEPKSPAEKAGLKQGDVITGFNGKSIDEPRDLARAVADTKKGETSSIEIWREGKVQTLEVEIGSRVKEETVIAADDAVREPVGLKLGALTDEARDALGLESEATGVVVAAVMPNSRAAESGVRPGDVIVKVGNQQVETPAEVASAIRKAERDKKEAVALVVVREQTPYYLALQLAT
ncbi:MAG: DegQ family serine endoprotease [Alphaproteobacteria bacterium]|nr:DegQ family serine endoprotease [Alphaproteobacteria bacterium]